jgi:hypothetical protein
MIKTAKAFVDQPEIRSSIKKFKAVSTGSDVDAQLGAIEDFINRGTGQLCHRGVTRRLRTYQGMGDAYLLPAIAAVVVGGTNIRGGRGRYRDTLFGVILIVLLNSVLSIMQMSEASRQIIYGAVIIAMLLAYGRAAKITS